MNARRLLLALLLALVPARAFAQLDDLLAPLTPEKSQPAKKKVKRKRHHNPRAHRDQKKDDDEEDSHIDLVAPLVPAKGELVVKLAGSTDSATVTVDGAPVKPGTKVEVDAGEHLVAVKRPGYSNFQKRVKVAAGATVEVPAVMDAVAGVLTVTADVPGTHVLVDGEPVGVVPQQTVLLTPGMHEVMLRHEGFEDQISRLSVRAGKEYSIAGTLKPTGGGTTTLVARNADAAPQQWMPDSGAAETETRVESNDWYKRWYVWAGVGAVVVAAATSAAVVSSNNSKGLTPADVCDLDPKDGQPGRCDDVINGPAALLRRGLNFNLGVRF